MLFNVIFKSQSLRQIILKMCLQLLQESSGQLLQHEFTPREHLTSREKVDTYGRS
jgi:hypothetical protein